MTDENDNHERRTADGQRKTTNDNQVLLFVDLLGVRARWLKGGREAAERAFQEFRNLVAASLRNIRSEHLTHGLVESDAAALTFCNVETALCVGRTMYLAAFTQTNRTSWLRGCIVKHDDDSFLRRSTSYAGRISHIELILYSGGLLDAISVEKSGFKGMRILVEKDLVTPEVNGALKQPIGHLNFMPLTKLRDSTYPARLEESFLDYLWMGTTERARFEELRRTMAWRLRNAASEPEEFIQAAATQVVFHECAAILNSLGGKVHYRELLNKRSAEVEFKEEIHVSQMDDASIESDTENSQ